ncbi:MULTISPECIES: hypothetical protein [Pseudomonas]|jgi:hypothetical protein|uniref:hypothetical protein n=1 Tax=Pseudomonas TaxID=286 RepID=UPI000F480DC0|nr:MULTISPECIES: hypothetical protein [Pseudomonas]MDP9781536.1 hypothetical protein [Pseudomonas fluorescens]QNR43753.1 hypothetical protein D5S12_21665 [Pseudomonas syringae]RON07916.1 hypothetical protein BK657_01905 [Pseudomonas brassicacearum]
MPNPLVIKGQRFSSQIEAERFFYAMRDRNLVSGGDIKGSTEFDLLEELYLRYCQATNWPTSGNPVAFYARNIARGSGPNGGTTQGFVVKFSDGSEQEFSVKKAVKALAT